MENARLLKIQNKLGVKACACNLSDSEAEENCLNQEAEVVMSEITTITLQLGQRRPGAVAHAYNPSTLGG